MSDMVSHGAKPYHFVGLGGHEYAQRCSSTITVGDAASSHNPGHNTSSVKAIRNGLFPTPAGLKSKVLLQPHTSVPNREDALPSSSKGPRSLTSSKSNSDSDRTITPPKPSDEHDESSGSGSDVNATTTPPKPSSEHDGASVGADEAEANQASAFTSQTYKAALNELRHTITLATTSLSIMIPLSTTTYGLEKTANTTGKASDTAFQVVNNDLCITIGEEYDELLAEYEALIAERKEKGMADLLQKCKISERSKTTEIRGFGTGLLLLEISNNQSNDNDTVQALLDAAEDKVVHALSALWRLWLRVAVLERERENAKAKMGYVVAGFAVRTACGHL